MYVENGKNMTPALPGYIATSTDGVVWSFINKRSLARVSNNTSATKSFLTFDFEGGGKVEIDMLNLDNHPTWKNVLPASAQSLKEYLLT